MKTLSSIETAEWLPSLRTRRIIAALLAAGIALATFVFLSLTRDFGQAFPFAIGLGALTLICLRWWTTPVHPGPFCYFSPHTVILLRSLDFYGFFNLPAMAYPDTISQNWSQDYYIHALAYALLGLFVFDQVYRWAVGRFRLNETLERCWEWFHSPRIQKPLPFLGAFWYLVGPVGFLMLSRRYVMATFSFAGASGEAENILIQSGRDLIGVAWAFLCLLFFQKKSLPRRLAVLAAAAAVVPLFFGFDSRTQVLHLIMLTVFCGFFYRNRPLKGRTVGLIVAALAVGFVIFSSHKLVRRHDPYVARTYQEEKNLFRRARVVFDSPRFLERLSLGDYLAMNLRMRLAGLDLPAAMIQSRRELGTPYLFGGHAWDRVLQNVPRLIWPGKRSWRARSMVDHFQLRETDQNISILSSAYADGGTAGVILGFAFLAFACVAIPKLVFSRRDGMLIYLASFIRVVSFHGTIFGLTALWFRWTLILFVVFSALSFLYWRLLNKEHAGYEEQADDPGNLRDLSPGLSLRGADPQPCQLD